VGFVYEVGKSGWVSYTTSSGDLLPLLGDASSGGWGFLAEASDSSVLGDEFWPSHSAFLRHIQVDVLLKTASKTFFPLPGRRSASRFELRPPATMKTGSLQGLVCNFLFIQEGPCIIWIVTTKFFL